jgi:hypothetical protein
MDGKFEKVKDELPLAGCNMIVAEEHVSKAKCFIHKMRTRGFIGTLPFNRIIPMVACMRPFFKQALC